jgi:subtilisin
MQTKRLNASLLAMLTVIAALPFGAAASAAPEPVAHILEWEDGASNSGASTASYTYTCNGWTFTFSEPVNFYCNGVLIPPDSSPAPPPPPSPTPSTQVTPWGIKAVNAAQAWSTTQGAGIKVAVIDTGIQSNHPDLAANIKGGVHFYQSGSTVYSNSNWEDDNGHGTHVAGTIGALNNTLGVVGVAPAVELYAVKVLDASGSGTLSAVAAGIRWAADHGMNVASMSLGSSGGSQALSDAVKYATSKGVVLVAASGNRGDGSASTTEVSYPAAYPSVIAVGAVDSTVSVASFSSSASYVALCAPGVSVNSTYTSSIYKRLSGTSMATPHVSGTAALVMATTVSAFYDTNQNGRWDPSEVKAKLQNSAASLGVSANFCGAGLVQASAAVA